MTKPTISIIAAISENRVIGENNRVPWKIKEDLVHLKNLTKDQVVVIGRKTYDSMVEYYQKSGRPMPGKMYLVVTRNQEYKTRFANAQVVGSLDEALEYAKTNKIAEIFAIGGGQIFTQLLPRTDKLYLTIVHQKIHGDAYFPDYSEFKKIVEKREGVSEKYKYTFLTLTRD